MPELSYEDGCRLVLTAPDTDAAFEDYAALIKTYRANGHVDISGRMRHELDFRTNFGVSPFGCDEVNGFGLAIMCAHLNGINMFQLYDLFDMVPPDSPSQALCIVEDALCILERVPVFDEMEGSHDD